MAILRHFLILTLPILLTGCYEDFTPDIDTRPVLCMNSLITAGEPIEVKLSHTWLFSDTSQDDHTVEDARIEIYANGQLQDADYIPCEGDLIRLVADSKVYGHAEATVMVPFSVKAEEFKWEPSAVEVTEYDNEDISVCSSISFNLSAEIIVPDRADTEDFYRFSYFSYYPSLDNNDDTWIDSPDYCYLELGSFHDELEPIFGEHIGIFESIMGAEPYGFTFFTDRQFSGRNYPLHIRFTNANFYVQANEWNPDLLDCGYIFTLRSVSKSYYNWVNYLWQSSESIMGEMSEIGLGDPFWGYSNVSTGAGVVAAQSMTDYTVHLRDFLETTLKNKIPSALP